MMIWIKILYHHHHSHHHDTTMSWDVVFVMKVAVTAMSLYLFGTIISAILFGPPSAVPPFDPYYYSPIERPY